MKGTPLHSSGEGIVALPIPQGRFVRTGSRPRLRCLPNIGLRFHLFTRLVVLISIFWNIHEIPIVGLAGLRASFLRGINLLLPIIFFSFSPRSPLTGYCSLLPFPASELTNGFLFKAAGIRIRDHRAVNVTTSACRTQHTASAVSICWSYTGGVLGEWFMPLPYWLASLDLAGRTATVALPPVHGNPILLAFSLHGQGVHWFEHSSIVLSLPSSHGGFFK